MRIAIIGSGALGLYYGAMLQRSGEDLHFLLRRDYQTIRQNGLKVFSVNGDFYLPRVAGYQSTREIGPVDLVLIGLKTFANQRLVELVRPLLGTKTAILTLQNGLGNEELLAGIFGPERILGGVAYLGSNRGDPGTVHHLGEGKIRLGEFSCGLSDRSQKIAAMFQKAGVPCNAVSDLRRARWEKLAWNIPFNGLSALMEQDVTTILNHPPSKELVRRLMLEVIAGANAQPLNEPIDAEQFSQQLISLTEKLDHYRPSMLIDRLEGRPLELEAIFSIPLARAHKAGIEMARVSMLNSLLSLGEKSG